jgi:hypothetical protein
VSYHSSNGRCFPSQGSLAAFRLDSGGSPDTTFGVDGTFNWDSGDLIYQHRGSSLLLEPDNRIVVAGSGWVGSGDTAMYRLLVLRLLEDGSLDSSFGDNGVFVGPTWILVQL